MGAEKYPGLQIEVNILDILSVVISECDGAGGSSVWGLVRAGQRRQVRGKDVTMTSMFRNQWSLLQQKRLDFRGEERSSLYNTLDPRHSGATKLMMSRVSHAF